MAKNIRKRTTRQLTAVYDVLRDDHSHPSAEEIHRRVCKLAPKVSLGTVYRNLQRLTDEGKIRTVYLGAGSARYDPTLEDHDHFICQRCGRVDDVWLARDRRVSVKSLVEKGLTITHQSLAIHGFCQRCGQKQSGRRGINPAA